VYITVLLLLTLLVLRRCSPNKEEVHLLERSVRDNVVHYNEEGGGEEDQVRGRLRARLGYLLTLLRLSQILMVPAHTHTHTHRSTTSASSTEGWRAGLWSLAPMRPLLSSKRCPAATCCHRRTGRSER